MAAPPLRVLIVEDSENDTQLVVRALRRGGYQPDFRRVDTAEDMRAALEGSAWDAVISDYSMPGFSGIDALRILQAHDSDIPFIMLSGVIGEDTAVAVMKAGAHDFLTKGNLLRLVPAIEREMREAAMRREHRRVENALRTNQAHLAAIVASSNDAIISCDLGGSILSWNTGAEQMFGWTAREAIGRSIRITMPEEEYGATLPLIERVSQGEQVLSADTVRVRKDGSRFHALVSYSVVRNQAGEAVSLAVILRDITERKQAEAALRQHADQMRGLTQRLSAAEETERRNINRELHDRIGPNLVALKLNLHLAHSRLPEELRYIIGAQIEDAQKVLETTVAQLRNVMSDLRPPALDDYGLFAALRTYADPYAVRLGVPVEIRGGDILPRLPLTVETALFRIAQEALNNIAKHAHAKHVLICIDATPARVVLRIEDDGRGFDPARTDRGGKNWGLRTMHERAQAINAELTVASATGGGTRVRVEVTR